ncbi:MAG: hypothetical protein LBN27_00370 [Prevotellaceae bacterium]|jgi:hypothetical protein|nr:hypothetical protein [Prevotellaceae bacterium]
MKKIFMFMVANILFASMYADVFTAGENVYFSTQNNSDWVNYGAKATAYFFNEGADYQWAGVEATKVSGTFYSIPVPGGADKTWTHVIFVRKAPGAASLTDWDDKWSQTVNIEAQTGNRCYYLNAGTGDNVSGNWGDFFNFTAGEKVYFSTTDNPAWTDNNAKLTAFFFNQDVDGQWAGVVATKIAENYYWILVPGTADKTWTNIIFVRKAETAANLADWDADVWNQTGDLTAKHLGNKCYYVKESDGSNDSHWGNLLWFDGAPTVKLLYAGQAESGVQVRDLGQFTSSFDCGTTDDIQLGGIAKPNFSVTGTSITLGYTVYFDGAEAGGNEILLTETTPGSDWESGVENIFSHFTAAADTEYGIQFWYKYEYAGISVYDSNAMANYKLHFRTPVSLPTDITNPSAQKEVKSVNYYSVSGQKVSENFNGLVIKKTIYADGEVKTEKVLK